MNWIRLALTVFAGGLVAALTEWLFMGDWLYKWRLRWLHKSVKTAQVTNGRGVYHHAIAFISS